MRQTIKDLVSIVAATIPIRPIAAGEPRVILLNYGDEMRIHYFIILTILLIN